LNFLNKIEILQRKKEVNLCNPCIYFLILNNEIVYVGQSVTPINRIYAHATDKTKNFDSYVLIECDLDKLDFYETEYIIKFNPIYNQQLPANSYYKGFSGLKNLYNIKDKDIKEIVQQYNLQIYLIGNKHYIRLREFNKAFKKYQKKKDFSQSIKKKEKTKGKERTSFNYLECKF